MFAGNHEDITKRALKVYENNRKNKYNIHTDNLKFVCNSNKKSDEGKYKSHPPQHFQHLDRVGYNSKPSIEKSISFFVKAYDHAVDYVCEGGEDNITYGLYFIGRAIHCIQDFYAHTSWVYIKKDIHIYNFELEYRQQGDKSYSMNYENKLHLSFLSPRITQNIWHNPWVPEFSAKKEKKLKLKKWLFRDNLEDMFLWHNVILSVPVYHPDIHLDISTSWASECYAKLFNTEKKGYWRASDLAEEHTREVWMEFVSEITNKNEKDNLDNYVYNEKSPNLEKCSEKFNEKMGDAIG